VNLLGVVNGIAACYPHMAARGRGAIVNTASGAGLLPRPFMTAYAAAKHAVVGLTTALAAEAAERGVSVHAVCPGYVDTGIQRASVYRNLDHERLLAAIPVKPISAERCAWIVLRGVARGRTIIPVTALTWFEWWLWRVSPALVVRLARWRAARFREHQGRPEGKPEQPGGA
jgi:NAD(P)-dependent dehydrogenase (short-subunit alcohol dehydrogenase family)